MKYSVLKNICGSATIRSGFVFLFFMLLNHQASAVCNVSPGFTYKDSGGVVYFTNTSTGANRFTLYFGDGYSTGSFMNTNSHTYPSYMKTVCVILVARDTTQNNCYDTLKKCIPINRCSAEASFTFRDSAGVFYFTNTSDSAHSYSWSFGEGGYSTQANPSHSYTFGRTRRLAVILTAWDTIKKCSDTMMRFVDVKGCNADARYSYSIDSFYYRATFRNASVRGLIYNWDFGDASSGDTSWSPVHTFAAPGVYMVRLHVSDTANNCYDSVIYQVEVYSCKVKASFTVRDSAKVHYFTNTSGTGIRFLWRFGDGSTSTAANPSHVYASGPARTVKVVMHVWNSPSNTKCHDSTLLNLFIPGCNTSANFTYTAFNRRATFTNTSSGYSYKWYFGDGNTSTVKNPVHNYSSPGSYYVKLVVSDSAGNCKDSLTEPVYLNGCPVKADFTVKDSAGRHYFTNTSTGAGSYVWLFGDGNTSISVNPSHAYSTTAYNYFYVILKARDSGLTCYDSIVKVIFVRKCKGIAAFDVRDSNTMHHFFSQSIAGQTNQWDFGDATSSGLKDPSHQYSGATRNITVRHIVYDSSNGCRDTASQLVYFESCSAYFTIQPDTNSNYSAIIVESSRASNKSTATYLWYFGDGDSSFSRTPTHVYSGAGIYSLCLNIYDSGCTSTYCRRLEFDSAGNMVSLGTPFSIKVIAEGEPNSSVNSVDYTAEIKVFPNPASGVLSIQSETGPVNAISLTDIQGRNILTETGGDNILKVQIEHLPQGLYILNVQFDNTKTARVKFIKN